MSEHRPAFLWDLDGTIFDTKDSHYKTWQYALNQFGFNLEQHIFDTYFGRNNHASLPFYLGFKPDPDFENEIVDLKESYFREIAAQDVRLVPGVQTWLSEVKALGFSQAIASSAPMENIQTLLTGFNLSEYFDAVISGEYLPAKPLPDVFLKAANALNHAPEDCWVLEDSLHGIEAAKSAGMLCLAVATTHDASELCKADLVLEDFMMPFIEVLEHFGHNRLKLSSFKCR